MGRGRWSWRLIGLCLVCVSVCFGDWFVCFVFDDGGLWMVGWRKLAMKEDDDFFVCVVLCPIGNISLKKRALDIFLQVGVCIYASISLWLSLCVHA